MQKAIDSLHVARTVHYVETQADGTSTNRFESNMTADASDTKGTSTNGAWAETVFVGGRLYERGSATGGAWWVLPDAAAHSRGALTITQLAGCITHGRLTGVGSLTGKNVVLADDGNAPGDAPARYYLSVGREVHLDRFVAHGPGRGGGPSNCGSTPRAGVTVEGLYSAYDAPVTVTPPTGAVPAPPGTK